MTAPSPDPGAPAGGGLASGDAAAPGGGGLASGDLAAALRRAAGLAEGTALVVVFGSVARGTPHPWSDVDLGIAGLPFWRSLELGAALGAALGREAHVVDLETASAALRFEVAREGVLVAERHPGDWATFQADVALAWFDLEPIVRVCREGVRQRLLREAAR